MKYVDEFRSKELALDLADSIHRLAVRPLRLMEVCGTHTMAIARHGIKHLLPENVKLVSGPGCPVCVTHQSQIDQFIALGEIPGTILTTFGDMIRVPGRRSSLEIERSHGADVRTVYSPLDAVSIASQNPDKRVFFFGIGFETTTPSVALAVIEARKLGLTNFFVLSAHKTMPAAIEALVSDEDVAIDGLICPGHVSAILGSNIYEPIAHHYGISCVVTGFEPLDILQSIRMLVIQIVSGDPRVEIQYSRAVSKTGNPAAGRCVYSVFEETDVEWRGLGRIPGSGLRLRPEYASFEAVPFLPEASASADSGGCECGSILKGLKEPSGCKAFATACTPGNPIGPCMVSNEGACAAAYRYLRC